MAKKTKGPRGSVISVNFEGIETKKLVAEGDHIVEVVEVSKEVSQRGNDYLSWKLRVIEGSYKGSTLYYTTSLQPQALWNLKSVLEALGFEVPSSAFEVDLRSLIGYQMGVTVEHETYNGKKRARVVDVYYLEDEDDEDEDDEDEDDEDEDDEDEDDEDED